MAKFPYIQIDPRQESRVPPLLLARGLRVRRGGRDLLAGVDLELAAGQLLTLVGPNGAGKSTLLKAVIGLIRPDAGSVALRPGSRVGYVPQYFQVDDNLPLTVRRFLSLQLEPPRLALADVAEELALTPLLGRPMQGLSGGELRRVLLGRALLRRPELLALDEPAAGLDVSGQTEIYRLIQNARERHGCAVLVVSHDLHLVMAATDAVICLNEGRMFCRGAPESVVEHPEYRALFGHHIGPATAVYAHHHHRQGPGCC